MPRQEQMMPHRIQPTLYLASAVLVGLPFLLAGPAQAQAPPQERRDAELRVSVVGPVPLPLQPVRLRVTVRNAGQRRLGPPLLPIETVSVGAYVKGPGDSEFAGIYGSILLQERSIVKHDLRPLTSKYTRRPLFLEPGAETSVSFAPCAAWQSPDGKDLPDGLGVPIFGREGRYALKCFYPLVDGGRTRLDKVVELDVVDPRGEDRVVYDLLKSDRHLASALMNPADPPHKDTVPGLQKILERAPRSSYAHYARFALARYYVRGVGHAFSGRVARAMAIDELEKLADQDFAYRPNAMVLLWNLDLPMRNRVRGVMRDHHRDSIEWLLEMSSEISDEKWLEFRVEEPLR